MFPPLLLLVSKCLEVITSYLVEIDDKFLFHENDYVAMAALRCAISKNSKHFDVYSKIVKQSIHSQSKLVFFRIFSMTNQIIST